MSRIPLSFLFLITAGLLAGQQVEVVPVQTKRIERTILLPGEIFPYDKLKLHARANGYVDRVLVDRGSVVRQGQLLATLSAPELSATTAEAESRVDTAEAARADAEARLAAAQATYDRLKKAAETVGAIAGNELIQAEKSVDAARATVRSAESSARAARAGVRVTKQSEAYLQVTAPFPGVITERLVHPGALVGPGNGSAGAMFELEQISRLRLVVPVPEANTASVRQGAHVDFRVPAYPGRTFNGTVARIDRSLDPKKRTMAVELDVVNGRNQLSPGTYPEVSWPAPRAGESLVVPATAVVPTTERTFVIRVKQGHAEWVNVRKLGAAGDAVEVLGPLSAGDMIVRRGTDEIRNAAAISTRPVQQAAR